MIPRGIGRVAHELQMGMHLATAMCRAAARRTRRRRWHRRRASVIQAREGRHARQPAVFILRDDGDRHCTAA